MSSSKHPPPNGNGELFGTRAGLLTTRKGEHGAAKGLLHSLEAPAYGMSVHDMTPKFNQLAKILPAVYREFGR